MRNRAAAKLLVYLAAALLGRVGNPALVLANEDSAAIHFTEKVLPLLQKHCYECHSHASDSAEGGLVLDSRAGWEKGGDSGPAIVPGRLGKSLLVSALEYSSESLQMPPNGRLPASEVAVFRKWIEDGAHDLRTTSQSVRQETSNDYSNSHLWSLEPLAPIEPPSVSTDSGVNHPVDRFVLAKLKAADVVPNGQANRYALLRRATFDLTGLPPSLDEIQAFVNDDRDDAWARVIDRLLESPRYGERWGRHWLDLARYGDSNGGDINYAHANAWRYRDYVIDSFNANKPYDEFILEQLAGDLLPGHGDEDRRSELLTATGFLMLGPKMLAEVDTDKLLIDIVDEQLDVTGLTFLGMTFGCARCHDHKFDPITTQDYYAMAGIFRSTKVIDVLRPKNGVSEWLEVDVTPDATRQEIDRLSRRKKELEDSLKSLGASAKQNPSTSQAAPRSVVVTGLPKLHSTTWAAWVRLNGSPRLGAVISADYDGAGQGHSLGFDYDGVTPRIVWNHGSGRHSIIASRKSLPLGEWHHLALTFDAKTASLKLFVDSQLAASADNVDTHRFSTIGVGRREASREWPLDGDVDEIFVFDSVLSDLQIERLFRKRPVAVRPLLHWAFDRASDGSVVDETGNYDGTLVGISPSALLSDGAVGHALSFSKPLGGSSAETDQIAGLRKQLRRIETGIPKPSLVMSVAAAEPVDLPVHIRGSHTNLSNQTVARGVPAIFTTALPSIEVPQDGNGRLQLAEWIANPRNPLTARVMVNRIWQHHFGHGLVRSSSNFGMRGEKPSHPELLDWLAIEFIRSGWSIKYMHRLIMTSQTYRCSSDTNEDARKKDPDNRLLASFPIRRLEAEAIRDALLAVSGELQLEPPASLLKATNKKRVNMTPDDPIYDSLCRSVYLPSIRIRSYGMFSVFDVSDNGQHVGVRPSTLVAQQALFLMNAPFVLERAQRVTSLVTLQKSRVEDRIDWLHRRLYGRPARPQEMVALSTTFSRLHSDVLKKSDEASSWLQIVHVMMCANEFIFVR